MDKENTLFPIAMLIEELKCDESKRKCVSIYNHRVNAVKNVGSIAVALGQERTRSELIPYIKGILLGGMN
jgi:serine/threonine-protein phosphatase 2A regulatory subunit A